MLIDFEYAHKRFLQGRSEGGQWLFNKANPHNPLAWKHLASHQIFSNNALGIAIAIRNDVSDEGVATAVFSGLRLSFSSKVNGHYPLQNDSGKISITLGVEAVRYLYSWLMGHQPTFRYDITRKGTSPKAITGFNTDGQFTHTLRILTSDNHGARNQIDVGLDAGHTFAITMFCVGYVQLLYPSIAPQVIADHLIIATPATPPSSLTLQAVETSHDANNCTPPSQQQVSADVTQQAESPPDRLRAQKAIYAVGMNKWHQRNLKVIEHIQANATVEHMDQMIKAGNRGEFDAWDRLASFLQADP